jgi:hypothetical protein
VTYSMSLELDGSRYEVRAERGASPAAVSLQLLECDEVCSPVQTLSGSIGVTGDEVVVSVPLAAIGAEPGDTIEGISASAGPGHPLAGTAHALDKVALPDAALPVPTVTVELGPTTGSEAPADLSGGMFSARIPSIAGAEHVTARACLGEDCGTATALLD